MLWIEIISSQIIEHLMSEIYVKIKNKQVSLDQWTRGSSRECLSGEYS